jgi:hypothetical protein
VHAVHPDVDILAPREVTLAKGLYSFSQQVVSRAMLVGDNPAASSPNNPSRAGRKSPVESPRRYMGDPRNNCLQLRRRGRWRLAIELDSVASIGFSGGERRAGWNHRSDRVARGSRRRDGGITHRQFETTGNAPGA